MENRNLITLKAFLAIHLFSVCKFVIIYRNFSDIAFDKINSQLYNNRIVIDENLSINKKLFV